MTRRGFLATLAASGAAFVAGCSELFPSRYRFRLTVEVATPQGLRTGSSVMEVASAAQTIKLPDSAALGTYLRGEAVAVDLPGETMFALITDTAAGETLAARATLALEPVRRGVPESFLAAVKKLGQRDQRGRTAELQSEGYPKLVRFRNIGDPNSIEAVDPADLAATFGPGVSLKRITVAVTDEPITTGIEKRLKWLPSYYEKLFNGERYQGVTPQLSGHVSAGSFSTEANK